jgi:alanine racemase
VARRLAPHSRVWAVTKANAYGHGLARAASALAEADGLALLELAEAAQMREAGYRKPLLLLEGFFRPADLQAVDLHGLTPVVHDSEQIVMLERAKLSSQIAVYLKLNTGMNRLGFAGQKQVRSAYDRLTASGKVASIVLMSHFAEADAPSGARQPSAIAGQMARLREWTAGITGETSLANSAAILRFPETHAGWVRPGIMLYGATPFAEQSAADLGLQPVMTLASEIIAVQNLQAGERVGYAGTFEARQAMRIGVVACGYADGYPRHAPSGTPVMVAGKRTVTVGRVSMDMLCVDLDGIPEARVGSTVVLWGEGLAVDEVAASAGTVGYELLCALAARVPQSDIN